MTGNAGISADIEFWYDFASPYAYMAAMRIEGLAEEAGVTVGWRPFIIGPLFQDFGHEFSPVFDNKVKWAYLLTDVPRQAAFYGVEFAARGGEPPAFSILGARVALLLAREGDAANGPDGLCPEFSKRLYVASFAEGKNIMEPEVVAEVLSSMGEDPEAVIGRALSPENKQALKDTVDDARNAGLFGIPSFTLPGKGGEMFWGNDRLEQVIAAAATAARGA